VTNAVTEIVVAVCTSRIDQLAARWQANLALLRNGEFFVLLDAPCSARAASISNQLTARGGRMVCHGETRGLSAARNTVLELHPAHRVLFIDDDILLNRAAVDAVRSAFAAGAHIVGARLVPPVRTGTWPWFFTPGQMHLVGWHPPAGPVKTWGAFMGIDTEFACQHGLRFDVRLGRTGRRLESGDDTSFVAAMKAAGAHEQLLPSVSVVHDVDPHRITLRYLVRRAYWQGRSEVRRGQIRAGLRKEWQRYVNPGGRYWPAVGYLLAVVTGVGHELLVPGRPHASGGRGE
jgi:hypothetical protein